MGSVTNALEKGYELTSCGERERKEEYTDGMTGYITQADDLRNTKIEQSGNRISN